MALPNMAHFRPGIESLIEQQGQITKAVESFGIDNSRLIITGGSALALAGIRPASDIDCILSNETFMAIHEAAQLPDGTPVSVQQFYRTHVIDSPPNEPRNGLSYNLILPLEGQNAFETLLEDADTHHPTGIRYLSPRQLLDYFESHPEARRARKGDVKLLRQHLGVGRRALWQR